MTSQLHLHVSIYSVWQFRPTSASFYTYIGGFISFVLLLNILLIFKLKRLSLLPIKYAQITIIYLLSTTNVIQPAIDLTAIMVAFKFSFEFLSPNFLNELLSWHNDDPKMQNLHFYWTSTLANYKCAIVMLLIGVFVYFALKVTLKKVGWVRRTANWLSTKYWLR